MSQRKARCVPLKKLDPMCRIIGFSIRTCIESEVLPGCLTWLALSEGLGSDVNSDDKKLRLFLRIFSEVFFMEPLRSDLHFYSEEGEESNSLNVFMCKLSQLDTILMSYNSLNNQYTKPHHFC